MPGRATSLSHRLHSAIALASLVIATSPAIAQTHPKAGIVLEGINSHGGGRANATGSEADWDSKAYQWNNAQTLAPLAGTGRLNLDQQAGGAYSEATTVCNPSTDAKHCNKPANTYRQVSPAYWFAQEYLAAHPELDRLVFVAHNKNGTGYCDYSWVAPQDLPNPLPPTPVPNSCNDGGFPSLTDTVDRYNAARDALIAQGYDVVPVGVFWHGADPDYDGAANWDIHQQRVDHTIAYLRASLNGFGNAPIVVGSGKTDAQLNNNGFHDALGNTVSCTGSATNDINYQANLAAVNKRDAYTAVFDNINPRYGFSTGLPIQPMTDCIHENYAGVQTLGHLRYLALARAAANSDPRAPLSGFSFTSSLKAFWDFRSGTPIDWTNNGNTLVRVGNNPPLFRYESAFNEYVWNRPGDGTSAGSPAATSARLFKNPLIPAASYTKVLYIKPLNLTYSQHFWSDQDPAATVNNHTLRINVSGTSTTLSASHGNTSVTCDASGMAANQWHLIVVTYAAGATASTGTMKLYVDGTTPCDTLSPAAGHSMTSGGYLGGSKGTSAQSLSAFNLGYAMLLDKALSASEIGELLTADSHLGDY
jgi:hypothetical protein